MFGSKNTNVQKYTQKLERYEKKLQKSYNIAPQQQINGVANGTRESFIDYLLGRGHYDLAMYQVIQYYCICSPVANAIDTVTRELQVLQPKVYDTKSKEFIQDHAVLDLLKKPNSDSVWQEFIIKYGNYYSLLGEAFTLATGNIVNPPLEIWSIHPQSVSVNVGSDGYIQTFVTSNISDSQTYRRATDKENRWRYYNNFLNGELFQTKNFNPSGTTAALRGKSPLQALYYEIEQYISGNKHNLSLLNRGATLSGFVSTDQELTLTRDQRTKLIEELNNYIAGAANAGRVAMLDQGLQFNSIEQNLRDMDFRNLKNDVTTSIYNRLKIPLPLISERTMTMANMEAAKLALYDNAVLPLANRLFSELTLLLMYRYKNSEDLIITYDTSDIPALEPRRNDELQKLQSLEVLTINEIRAKIGREDLTGGDVLLAPSTEVPVAQEDNTDDTKSDKEKFTEIMQKQFDANGKRKFSDSDIEEIAEENGL